MRPKRGARGANGSAIPAFGAALAGRPAYFEVARVAAEYAEEVFGGRSRHLSAAGRADHFPPPYHPIYCLLPRRRSRSLSGHSTAAKSRPGNTVDGRRIGLSTFRSRAHERPSASWP